MNSMKKIFFLIVVGLFVVGLSDLDAVKKGKDINQKDLTKLAILKAKAKQLRAELGQASDSDNEDVEAKSAKKVTSKAKGKAAVISSDEEESEESEEESQEVKKAKKAKTPVRRKTSGKRTAASASWCSASKVLGIGAVTMSALLMCLVGSGYYYDSGALPPGDYTGLWVCLSALGLGGAGAHALRS